MKSCDPNQKTLVKPKANQHKNAENFKNTSNLDFFFFF
jgi:hypothetical protein